MTNFQKSQEKQRVMNTSQTKGLRRSLRKDGTRAEVALWKIIKGKKVAGLQFRRQFSVGNYILDFYCPILRLAIELDGGYHCDEEIYEKDLNRDETLLKDFKIKTIRFTNDVVFYQPEAIVNSIEMVAGLQPAKDINAPYPPLILEGDEDTSTSERHASIEE